jgi:hypothetical protein
VSPVSGSGLSSVRVPAASFGQNSVGIRDLTGTTLPVSRAGASSSIVGGAGSGQVVSPYWIVVTRTSSRAGDMGPVRFRDVSSAQSLP